MSALATSMVMQDAKIPTWFGIGGRADHFAQPTTVEDLGALLEAFRGAPVRVLGDGANLLVDDEGVDGLVISLAKLDDVEMGAEREGFLRVGAGVNLPKLITHCVREGLAGLETLAGIPASVGGAVRMNAGGAFGEIGPLVHAVEAIDLAGGYVRLERPDLRFGYRTSGLERVIITHVELRLEPVAPDEQPALRQKLKDVMAYKKHSQPMASDSAGCVFKNPLIGGVRTSAGKLIDLAGCKGQAEGGAEVSSVHANFIVTEDGCTARHVLDLMQRVKGRVQEAHAVALEPEIVIWTREGP